MKLFHKIFLCFLVIFGITFQTAGYVLINFAYENAIEQEKKLALQNFQYNQYILQSLLYNDPDLFLNKDADLTSRELLQRFTVPVALYSMYESVSKYCFSNLKALPDETVVPPEDGDGSTSEISVSKGDFGLLPDDFDPYKKDDYAVSFQIREIGGESFIFTGDYIRQSRIYLVTQTDITPVVKKQKSMIAYFQSIYLVILCISFPLVLLLTNTLTSPLKKVTETAGRIAKGNYSGRIEAKGRDEISALADSFNLMASQVEEKIAELSDAARQKEDFTANFAHELKTPMTSVIGYADMLYQRDLPREEVKSAAGYILDEGMRLEALSQKLMDLFVLDRHEFFLEEMPAGTLFDNIKQGIAPLCDKQNVALHMDIAPGSIRVDFDLFKTMLLNLADNAVKAGCRDLWLCTMPCPDGYRMEIADNGRGIPPQELGKITEAFYMVDKSRSRKQHGAGLGLSLVAKIADIHHAAMQITSDGKTGTVIRMTFAQTGGDLR